IQSRPFSSLAAARSGCPCLRFNRTKKIHHAVPRLQRQRCHSPLQNTVWFLRMAFVPLVREARTTRGFEMTIKTILVGVDGSKQAARADEVAADMAQSCGAKLLVLHVVAPIFEGSERDALANLAHIEHMDERIEGLSGEIDAVAHQDAGCERLMSVPGIG